MKNNKNLILSVLVIIAFSFTSFSQSEGKLVSKKTHFKIYSHTTLEDIEANNYKSVGTFNTITGEIVFSVPMQSYEFEKSLMQKHYNSKKFLNTKQFPKSKFKGNITNLSDIDFKSDGKYNAIVEGELNMHGVSNNIKEKITITINGSKLELATKFNLTLTDYAIAFKEGKPSTNIAKVIEITVVSEY